MSRARGGELEASALVVSGRVVQVELGANQEADSSPLGLSVFQTVVQKELFATPQKSPCQMFQFAFFFVGYKRVAAPKHKWVRTH